MNRRSRPIVAGLIALGLMASCGGQGGASRSRAAPATTGAPATQPLATTSSTAPTAPGTAAATGPPATGPCGTATAPPAAYHHVVWIWMENHSRQQVLGDPSAAPYETGLARQCGTATQYASVGSPSLPNYIGATSGDTQGIQDDAGPEAHRLTVDNLFRQVRTASGTERSFEEAMGSPCQQAPAGRYAVKHNPAAYYTGANDRAACAVDDVSLDALGSQLAAGTLPTFAFVTPDLCDDTHDCPVSVGDAWLATWVPRILASPAYRDATTAVFVMWDEDTPMPNLIVAPSVVPGISVSVPFTHYSLLRTTEELLGLSLLGRAQGAASMRAAFRL